jgi:hypothetical protein
MLRFSCKITGDDYQMLATETPSSKKKVMTLAFSVFVPTILWFVNGLLLTYSVMDKPLFSAVIVGLIAAFVIFLIEKLIVMSNGSLFLTLFRGFLAFLVAILGSVFLDEVIFVKDINQQVALNKELLIDKQKEEVQKNNAGQLTHLDSIASVKYSIWQSALASAQSEADGSGGSGVKGVHAITLLKLNNANIKEKDYREAQADLDILQQQIKSDQNKVINTTKASFEDQALLVRIKAMFDLATSDKYLLAIYIVVTLILFCLEFIVIIFKITMKKTNYEYRLELIEEIGRKRMEKVLNNDLNHYDNAKAYSAYKDAKKALSNSGSNSIFN